MRDYDFGNLLYKLRIESGYTQKDIADMLGVTDKAVSKWENGIAKPTTNNIIPVYGDSTTLVTENDEIIVY